MFVKWRDCIAVDAELGEWSNDMVISIPSD